MHIKSNTPQTNLQRHIHIYLRYDMIYPRHSSLIRHLFIFFESLTRVKKKEKQMKWEQPLEVFLRHSKSLYRPYSHVPMLTWHVLLFFCFVCYWEGERGRKRESGKRVCNVIDIHSSRLSINLFANPHSHDFILSARKNSISILYSMHSIKWIVLLK